ncbi:Cathepsin L-like proteinase [Schistosoma japonicum]|nr:Cathepsin L-like proteinase [Schistosoma japonicum]
MNFIFILLILSKVVCECCVSALETTTLDSLWKTWKRLHDKHYTDRHEEVVRRRNWNENLVKIHLHNLRYDLGVETYEIGLSRFSDVDWNEFRSWYSVGDKLDIPETVYITDDDDNGNNAPSPPESCLVYEPRDQDQECMANSSNVTVRSIGYKSIQNGSESDLRDVICSEGPYVVTMNIDENFLHYKSGIYQSIYCNESNLNQSMAVIGYDSNEGIDYWILKNSWGTNWGEDGFVYVRRNYGNMCGIASFAFAPVFNFL